MDPVDQILEVVQLTGERFELLQYVLNVLLLNVLSVSMLVDVCSRLANDGLNFALHGCHLHFKLLERLVIGIQLPVEKLVE